MSFGFRSVSRRDLLLRGFQVGAGVFAAGGLSYCRSLRCGGAGKYGANIRF